MTAFLVTPTCPGFNGLRWRYRSNSIRAGAGGLTGPRARSGERDGHTAAGAREPACTCVRAIGAEPLNQRCDLRWWWGEEKKQEKRKNGTSAILFQRFCPTALSSWPAIGLVVTVETNEKPTPGDQVSRGHRRELSPGQLHTNYMSNGDCQAAQS